MKPTSKIVPRSYFGFAVLSKPDVYQIYLPSWLVAAGILGLATVPWYTRKNFYRFSLRTLLIATTLIAVVLGLIVCLSH